MTITVEGLDHKFEKGTLTSIELAIWWVQDSGLQEDALEELGKLRKRILELEKIVNLNIADTGGGCSLCGEKPAVWHNEDNWLCHTCFCNCADIGVSVNNAHTVYDDGGRA